MNKIILFLFLFSGIVVSQNDWIHKVRIAGNPLTLNNSDSIIQHAEDSHVFGIEVDNDIPGRYESFLNPNDKLEAISQVAQKAHEGWKLCICIHCRIRMHNR